MKNNENQYFGNFYKCLTCFDEEKYFLHQNSLCFICAKSCHEDHKLIKMAQ